MVQKSKHRFKHLPDSILKEFMDLEQLVKDQKIIIGHARYLGKKAMYGIIGKDEKNDAHELVEMIDNLDSKEKK